MKFIPSRLIIALIVVLGLYGCKSNPTEPTSTNIITGTSVDLTMQSVPPSGGKITINKPGDSLNGLTIDVPNGAYTDARSFHISYAPITKHEFGSDFNPLTPLITIENGGGYSDSIMVLRIPVHVPIGQFAMAFLYDATSGQLEAMPLLESDSEHVTVCTMNFEHSTVSALGKPTAEADEGGSSKIIVAGTPEASLDRNPDSGFDPAKDGWEFPAISAYGLSIDVGPGMIESANYYYLQRWKRGGASSRLHGRYDDNGVLNGAPDNIKGIKLSAMVTLGLSRFSLRTILAGFGSLAPDRIILYGFKDAIARTGEPQFLQAQNDQFGTTLLVYKVEGNNLLIYNPAAPGKSGIVRFDPSTGHFLPISIMQSSGGTVTYTQFFQIGVTSIINWHTPAKHWKEVDNGTIGKGTFPEYTLQALNENDEFVPLVDDFKAPGGRLTVSVRGVGFTGDFQAYDGDEKRYTKDVSSVQIHPGKQKVGLMITDAIGSWVDFKWITVDGGENGPFQGSLSYTYRMNDAQCQATAVPFVIVNDNGDPQIPAVVWIRNNFDNSGGNCGKPPGFHINNFHGADTYPLVTSGTTTDDVWGGIGPLVGPGTFIVTDWSTGHFSGTFKFTEKGFNGSPDIVYDGSFQLE